MPRNRYFDTFDIPEPNNDAHCYICHSSVPVGAYHPQCTGGEMTACNMNCPECFHRTNPLNHNLQEGRELHCYVCHQQYVEGHPHPMCEGSRFTPCTGNCTTEQIEANPYDPNQDRNANFYGRSIAEELQNFPVPDHSFEEIFNNYTSSRRRQRKIEKVKTLEQVYAEMRDNLLSKISGQSIETLDEILRPYIEEREEIMLFNLLKESDHLRTSHDLRSFIREYMFRNK